MPIFEYRCKDCGEDFEKIHLSRESQSQVACPSCEGERVEKRLSTFGTAVSGGQRRAAELPGPCGHCENPAACGLD